MRIFVVSVILFFAAAAMAADYESGAYITGGGVGGVECRQFVAIVDQAERHDAANLAYNPHIYHFTMYVLGFKTAYNLQTSDTCDVFGRFTSAQLLKWLNYYCQAHPAERFGSAVALLGQGLHSGRVRTCQR